MHVMIVTFGYDAISAEDLEMTSVESAPAFAAIPGLLEKTWLHDPKASRCGGVYKFTDRASVEAYLGSDLWAGVQSEAAFSGFEIAVYDMMEGPTEM